MDTDWLIFERKNIHPDCASALVWLTATTREWAERKIEALGKGLDLVIFSTAEWNERGERIANGEG